MIQVALLCFVAQICCAAVQRYQATGLLLGIDQKQQTVTISHQSIPGLMDAMAMPFHVREAKELHAARPGDSISFSLVVNGGFSWVEGIRVVRFESAERDPALASRLKLLDEASGRTLAPLLAIGQRAADFALTDQDGRPRRLSDFAGKVVAMNFVYTRCPLPDYCFRLSNNFGRLQKRFAGERDLVLLTVTFDPVHDRPQELARYARIWRADLRRWHFLTGTPTEIQRVCVPFGVQYWPDDGVLTHSLHTVLLDRSQRLAANLEGNKFTAEQLGDLVQTILRTNSKRE